MLDVICTHCGKTLKISEEYLGRKGKCNHCQGEITVVVAPLKFSTGAIEATAESGHEKAANAPPQYLDGSSELIIPYKCPMCGALLHIPGRYAGQRERCTTCNAMITVPRILIDEQPPQPPRSTGTVPPAASINEKPKREIHKLIGCAIAATYHDAIKRLRYGKNQKLIGCAVAILLFLGMAILGAITGPSKLETAHSPGSRTATVPKKAPTKEAPETFIPLKGDAFFVGPRGNKLSVMREKDWGSTQEAFLRSFVYQLSVGDKLRVLDDSAWFTVKVRIETEGPHKGDVGWVPSEVRLDCTEVKIQSQIVELDAKPEVKHGLPEISPEQPGKNLGIPLDSARAHFAGLGFLFEDSTPVHGQKRLFGRCDNLVLELIGSPAVAHASLMSGVGAGDTAGAAEAVEAAVEAFYGFFLKRENISDIVHWLGPAIGRAASGQEPQTQFAGKTVCVQVIKTSNGALFVFTVKPF